MNSSSEVTQLLVAWSTGDAAALEQLVPLVQTDLRCIAKHYLQSERPHHLLQTTALVNEAWIRLMDWHQVSWQNRAQFFSVAAGLMRHILVDEARKNHAIRHGGELLRVSLSEANGLADDRRVDLLALDFALKELAEFDARKSKIVELRFFAGLSVEETAEVMQLSPRTVMREWDLAKAWLSRELSQ